MYFDNTSPMTPDEKQYYDRLTNLMKDCTIIDAFSYEGITYKGNHVGACKEFIKNNHAKADFSVWLDNNYEKMI